MKYLVSWNSEILGEGHKIMTEGEIKKFNLVAHSLLSKLNNGQKSASCGMWTVEVASKKQMIEV